MEVPLEARIPKASFDRGENLDLERKSGLLKVTQLPVAELGQEPSPRRVLGPGLLPSRVFPPCRCSRGTGRAVTAAVGLAERGQQAGPGWLSLRFWS